MGRQRKRLRRSSRLAEEREEEPVLVRGMDAGNGPDAAMMVDVGVGPNSRIPSRYYAKRKRTYRRKTTYKRRKSYRRRSAAPGYQVYHPTGDVAGIIGRGDYRSAFSSMGKAIKRMIPEGAFSRIGTAGGGAFGGKLGASLGGLMGQGIANIAGFGAYDVSANSLMAQVAEGVQIPQFHNGKHATLVAHREYLGDIVVPSVPATFTNTSYALNPGLGSVFPWLSGVASNYDQYQIMGMIFEFRTLSSDITSGGALGSVILATDYDSVDSAFTSKVGMENSEYAVSNKPSVDTVHCIECDPSLSFSPIKYIRSGAVPSGKDPRLYDHGHFQLATSGLPGTAGTVLGELWCSYEVALYKPNLVHSEPMLIDKFSIPTPVTATHWLARDLFTIETPLAGSTLGGTTTVSTYSFPASAVGKSFQVQFIWWGDSGVLATKPATNIIGCTDINLLQNRGVAVYSGSTGQTSGNQNYSRFVTVTTTTGVITVTAGTIPTAGTVYVDIIVSQIPDQLLLS